MQKATQTIRQQLIALLENDELSARDISQTLGIREKDVYAHLSHIQKSVKALKKKLRVTPFRCLSCGYIFESRKRLSKPSRCPKCKRSHIEPATFSIN